MQVTGLGRYINDIRRKTTERGLSRRIKRLLKTWQKIVETSAAAQNGLQQARPVRALPARSPTPPTIAPTQPPVCGSTLPPPTRSPTPSLCASEVPPPSYSIEPPSLNPSTLPLPANTSPAPAVTGPEATTGQKRAGSRNEAAVKRERLQTLFSAVKKTSSPQPPPPLPPPLLPLTVSTGVGQSTSSQLKRSSPPPLPLIEDITPVEAIGQAEASERQLSTVVTSSIDRNGLESCHNSPLDAKSLLVRVPASYHKNETNSFVVSLPRHLVQVPTEPSPTTQSDIPVSVSAETPLSLLVSIDKFYLVSLSSNSRLQPMALQEEEEEEEEEEHLTGSSPRLPVGSTIASSFPKMLPSEASVTIPSTGAPSGRLKRPLVHGVPQDSIDGVDGCLGRNGVWYTWTEFIPSQEDSVVTILPYVYVDGWDCP